MQMKDFDIREALLASGKEEFLTNGFERASLRAICRSAGVTTGAFYAYFPRKEALFEALVKPTIAAFHEMYDSVIGRELADLTTSEDNELRAIEFITEHRDAFRLLFDCAEGTRYAGFKAHLIEDVFDKTYQLFFDHYAGVSVDPALVRIIVRMKFQEYMELIYGGYPMDKVKQMVVQLSIFSKTGFDALIQTLKASN